jgi:hypothetical protein
MNVHDDDILEYALNKGITSTAIHYNITREKVYNVVLAFKRDVIDLPCMCEIANAKGHYMNCEVCEKGFNPRINV